MKTVQDWGFISKEQGLVKPKLQDNKIFHALTTAYENNNQQEIYGATENIVRRERELCEMALADLKKLSSGKGDQDGTLKLVMGHYQSRLELAREKEEKIGHLSEDSRKMTEEYKKRTQELAEVKRNLMDSQTKLRDLAKNTERLLKKEEELRFIESNLRSELENNKKNIMNGLYEIVTDFSDQIQEPVASVESGSAPAIDVKVKLDVEPITMPRPAAQNDSLNIPKADLPFYPTSIKGAETIMETAPKPTAEATGPSKPRLFTEGLFKRNDLSQEVQFSGPISPPSQNPLTGKEAVLVEKAGRLRMFEPGKSMVSKSMVKTGDGEVISEYFYSPLHPREGRHYIFNSLYAVSSLLGLKGKNLENFHERIETVLTDLLSRLEHSQNIHLESFLSEEINMSVLAKILAAPKLERPDLFDSLATRLLNRIESVGPGRAGLIDHQFRQMPKPNFPPRPGLTA